MNKWIYIDDEPIPHDWSKIKKLHSPRIGNFDMPDNPTVFQEDTIRKMIPECTAWQKNEPQLIFRPPDTSSEKYKVAVELAEKNAIEVPEKTQKAFAPYPEIPSEKHAPKPKAAPKHKRSDRSV